MDDAKKIEGLDRFLLVGLAFLLVDALQVLLYALAIIPPVAIVGWVWGILGSLCFGFWLSTLGGGHLFGIRLVSRLLPYVLAELVPLVGMLPLLSVGLFLATLLHNREVDDTAEGGGATMPAYWQ